MPIEIPTLDEVVRRSKTDVQLQIPGGIDPFNKNNVVTAMTVANANRVFDFYIQLQIALLESLPDTAVQLLDRWAAIFGVIRLAATEAQGTVIATSLTGTGGSIPNGTIYTAPNGVTYTVVDGPYTVVNDSLLLSAMARQSNVVTCTTSAPHGFADNTLILTVTGSDPSSFNLTNNTPTQNIFPITVLNATQFSYIQVGVDTVATTPGTLTYRQVAVGVTADDAGTQGNQDLGTTLTVQTPLVNVDNEVVVGFDEIGGGTDQESNESVRSRMLSRIQNPVAHFNPADIEARIKQVNGITRVFVFPLEDPDTGVTPTLGTVTVYFMRDNDEDPIPSASEVAAAQAKLDEIRPANTAADDAVVKAPAEVDVGGTDIVIDSLVPDTTTMQAAVTANLAAYFADETAVAVDVVNEALVGVIFNTVDPDTGDRVQSFSLTTPAGDIVAGTGEIATLGDVSFT